jgi:hypothetical protein
MVSMCRNGKFLNEEELFAGYQGIADRARPGTGTTRGTSTVLYQVLRPAEGATGLVPRYGKLTG